MSDDDSSPPGMVARQTVLPDPDEDTLRIMLSTDNHLGYAERDPVRRMDSFAAFEEVLYLAKQYRCDMVLLSGDLFHENRPSQRTLYTTMDIIRRYCFGQDPVRIQILSDQQQNFQSGVVNYQDENMSVDLPIFSIHGNHDDPTRDPTTGQLLASLDLLSIANLVNYFGRQDAIDKVEVSPVLIQKGTTQVALYGMGSMRDERLNRMWQGKKVRFLRPEEDDNDDDDDENNEGGFFNIFTLHQNRDLGRGSKNCVQENMIPDWMDLVVWGHEHECLIEFFESIVGTFRITQPGSSVATSLVAGEAVRKCVGVLDIKGKNFRLHPVPLTQVRGFATTEISLKEHKARLDPDDPKIDEKIGEILDQEVKLMVATARRKRQELIDEAKEAGNNAGGDDGPLKHKILKPNEVLVRIRVDHQGFTAISNQRFGARYVGEVANPTDILLFHRRKETRGPSLSAKQKAALAKTMVPEELERTNMEDLVSDQLNAPDRQLKLMDRQRLNTALEEYVDKKLTATIGDTVTSMLKETQKKFIKRVGSEGAGEKTKVRDELDKETQQKTEAEEKETKRKEKRKSQAHDKVEEEEEEDVVEEQQPPRRGDRSGKENSFDEESQESAQKPSSSKSQTARSAAGDAKRKADRRRQLLDDSDDDMEVEETVKPKAKARERRSASKRPVVYNLDDSGEDEEDAFVAQDDEDEDEDEELEVDEVVPAKKSRSKRTPAASKKRPAARARSTSTSGTARKSSSSRKKSTSRFDDSDDEDDAPYGGSIELNDDWGTAATRSQI